MHEKDKDGTMKNSYLKQGVRTVWEPIRMTSERYTIFARHVDRGSILITGKQGNGKRRVHVCIEQAQSRGSDRRDENRSSLSLEEREVQLRSTICAFAVARA